MTQTLYFIVIFLITYLLFFSTGALIRLSANIQIKTPNILLGFIFFVTVFSVLSIPFMVKKTSFLLLFWTYMIVVLIFIACLIVFNYKKIHCKNILHFIKIRDFFNVNNILLFIIICFIIFQCYMLIFYGHSDADDSFYVAISNTVLTTNKIFSLEPSSGNPQFAYPSVYSLVSYELFVALISKLLSINSATLFHTVIPVVLLILHYYLYYQICRELSEDHKNYLFLFIVLLDVFSYLSNHTPGTYMLFRFGQGKASIPSIILPWLVYEYIKVYKYGLTKENVIIFSALFYYGFHVSTVGLFLIPLTYFSLTITFFIKDRKIKNFLYLCIPVLCALPFVLLKYISMMGDSTSTSVLSAVAVEGNTTSLNFKDCFLDVFGSKRMILFWIISIIVIIIFSLKEEKKHINIFLFCITPIIIFATYLNPLIMTFVSGYITGTTVYWRLFWTLQPYITMICAFGLVLDRFKKSKIVLTFLIAVIIIFSGKWFYSNDYLFKAENHEKLNSTSINIANTIADIKLDAFLLIPEYYQYEIRQVRGDVSLVISRYRTYSSDSSMNTNIKNICNSLYSEKIFYLSDYEYLNQHDVDYVAIYNDTIIENSIPIEEVYSDQNLKVLKLY